MYEIDNPENLIDYQEIENYKYYLKISELDPDAKLSDLREEILNIELNECSIDIFNFEMKGKRQILIIKMKVEFYAEGYETDIIEMHEAVENGMSNFEEKIEEIIETYKM